VISIGHVTASLETPQIIAELGINHGGSLAVAKDLARAHVAAGARIVKGQTHCDDEYAPRARKVVPANASEPVDALVARCSLSEADERELQQYVTDLGAVYISTPFSRKALDRLARMDVPAIKIGSGEMSNHGLLELVAQLGRPVVMSTGMHAMPDVAASLDVLGRVPVVLMHTTSLYPTPPEHVRLARMQWLADRFGLPVGLSDHSITVVPCAAAVAMGAVLVERHVTDDSGRLRGPDIACSSRPGETAMLRMMIDLIAKARPWSGSPDDATREFAVSTVTAMRDLEPGDVLTRDNCFPMRPGPQSARAIPGDQYRSALGAILVEPVRTGAQVTWGAVAAQ
jgi:N-acetylneuraminate synthase